MLLPLRRNPTQNWLLELMKISGISYISLLLGQWILSSILLFSPPLISPFPSFSSFLFQGVCEQMGRSQEHKCKLYRVCIKCRESKKRQQLVIWWHLQDSARVYKISQGWGHILDGSYFKVLTHKHQFGC